MFSAQQGDQRFVVGFYVKVTTKDVAFEFVTRPRLCERFLFYLGVAFLCVREGPGGISYGLPLLASSLEKDCS